MQHRWLESRRIESLIQAEGQALENSFHLLRWTNVESPLLAPRQTNLPPRHGGGSKGGHLVCPIRSISARNALSNSANIALAADEGLCWNNL